MSTITTSLPSYVSIVEIKRTDSRASVEDVEYSLSMVPLCLLTPATILTLAVLSPFFQKRVVL